MKRLFVMFVFVFLLSHVSLWAQDVPKSEIFGGFSVLSLGSGVATADRFNPVGWQASWTGNINKSFGIVADFGGQYKQGIDVYEYLGGVQFGKRQEKLNAFAHALLGGGHSSFPGGSDNFFTLGFGGGLDVGAGEKIAVRVVQFDWLPSHSGGDWESNVIRFGFGIVFKSGKK